MSDNTPILDILYILTNILDKAMDIAIVIAMAVVFAIGGHALLHQKAVSDSASATHYASIKPVSPTVTEEGMETEAEAVTETEDVGHTFEDLMALNPDAIAWLTIPDTGIDHPVVQTTNNTKYVNTDIYGEFSMSGTPFLDRNNSADFSDAYSIIYGHHLSGGVLFGALDAFEDPTYLLSHQVGELMLKDRVINIEWIAYVETDAYDETFMTPFKEADPIKDSVIQSVSNGRYQGAGKLITLSTCGEKDTNARTLLIGRIVE